MNHNHQLPLVSILLPIHNAENTLSECIDSILQQTYLNFEIIALDDGSTDRSVEVLNSYTDERIKLYRCRHNYIRNLNRGLSLCNGKYIARMDADDKMCNRRIEKQVEILEKYEQVDVCCSVMKSLGVKEEIKYGFNGILPNLKVLLLRGNFLSHPTMMFRKSLFLRGFRYKKDYIYAEDYKLWVDLALEDIVFYNIPEALIEYRTSTNQVSFVHNKQQTRTAWIIREELLEKLIRNSSQPLRCKLNKLYPSMLALNQEGLISPKEFYDLFANIFQRQAEKDYQ